MILVESSSCYDQIMAKRLVLLFFLVIALIASSWLLFRFFGIQTLFIDQVVDEPLPETNSTTTSVTSPTTPTSTTDALDPRPSFIQHAEGSFEQGDSTYTIQGKAAIIKNENETRLTLTDFSVTNGPDLYVYLVSTSSTKNAMVKTAVKKGSFQQIAVLKGNRGNQSYQLPRDLQITDDIIVTIWCKRFSRHFGSAHLVFKPV